MKRLTLTGLLLFAALLLSAQPLQLAHVFSDHAVLQRETAAPVWGWGEPGKTVTVTASGTQEAVKAKVADDGSWRVTLPTDAAGGYVDGESLYELRAAGVSVDAALSDNDAYHALRAIGGLIMTGPTGTNVNDVAVALIGEDA